MEVQLINITNKPIENIFKSYRICYSKLPYSEVKERTEEDMIKFIKPLMAENHTSPLEHINLTFAIDGISRACLSQLTRHRTMSFNVKSQRYNSENEFKYVIPKSILENEKAKECFINSMELINEQYKSFVAMGIDKEDARALLPNACATNLVVTVDLNNFRKFLALRLCVSAQTEIRELAIKMRDLVKEQIPFVDYKVMNCGVICNRCKGE